MIFESRKYIRVILIILIIQLFTVKDVVASYHEEMVKTAFILKFVDFIENNWVNSDDISFCIFGRFDNKMEEGFYKLSGVSIVGKNIKIKLNPNKRLLNQCNILYFTEFFINDVLLYISDVQAKVITIGSIPYFLESGGMIEFYDHRNSVRFRINNNAIKKSKILFSSKLLELGME